MNNLLKALSIMGIILSLTIILAYAFHPYIAAFFFAFSMFILGIV